MSDFKTRLVNEQKELEERITKLETFLESQDSYEIDPVQRMLLVIQLNAMRTYNECLEARLSLL